MSRTFANQRSRCIRLAAFARRLCTDRRGVAGIITAISAPVLIGFVALAVDASMWQANQKSLQGAADQAAMAGANAFILSGVKTGLASNATAKAAALAVAKSFGYDQCPTADGTYGTACTSGYGANAGEVSSPTSTLCQADPTECLEVTITEPQRHFLSQIVFNADVVAGARAVATLNPTTNSNCVLALDQTSGTGPSVSIKGNSDMTLTQCSLMNDLNDPNATDETAVSGNPQLTATGGGKIQLAQDQAFVPSGNATISPTPVSNVAPVSDPYSDRTAPSTAGGCTYPGISNLIPSSPAFDNVKTITSTTVFGTAQTVGSTVYNVVFTPASPTTPVVFCGGIKATGGNIYLNPGIYVMDGGGFTYSGNGAIYGHNITIYVTCDSKYTSLTKDPITGSNINPKPCTGANNNYGGITITGTTANCSGSQCPKVDITPPCDGNTASPCSGTSPPSGTDGISLWIDKSAPSGNGSSMTVTGDTNLKVDGVMYAPDQTISFSGGNTTNANTTCNQIVAYKVALGGNNQTAISQAGCNPTSGVAYLGPPKLIE